MKTALALALMFAAPALAQGNPSTMPKVGSVDPRFQSYNVEMVEVIGGRFWKPYGSTRPAEKPVGSTPGLDPSLYEQRTHRPVQSTTAQTRGCAWPGIHPGVRHMGEHHS